MNIQPITVKIYQYQTYNYCSNPSFNGLLFNTNSLAKKNIGSMQDGIIGKIRVKNTNNKDFLFRVEKFVEESGLEHYAILDKTGGILGEIEFKPVITNDAKHIWVEHLVSHGSRHHRYRNEELGDYTGIGARLMQIALKRSKEAGCDGNIELFAVNSSIDFYKKIGMKDFFSEAGVFKQRRMFLPEENKVFLSEKYGGL